MKSGVHYTMTIILFNGKIAVSDNDFTFDIKAHKGVEVVDMR